MRGCLILAAAAVLAGGCAPDTSGVIPDYALSIAPAALTIARGAIGTTTVTIVRVTFTGSVALSLPGPPTGVTGSYDPVATTGTSSTLTLNVGSAVTLGDHSITVRGSGIPGNRSTTLMLTVN